MKYIQEKTNIYIVIGSFLLFAVFIGFVAPYVQQVSMEYTNITESPDTSINFFNLSKLAEMRANYGIIGRSNYIYVRWSFDFIYPLVYTFFFVSAIAYLTKKANHGMILLWVPLIAMAFDYSENILATIYFAGFPRDLNIIGYFLMSASLVKWIFVLFDFLALSYLGYYLILHKRKGVTE